GRVPALGKPDDFVGRVAIERGLPDDARVLVGLRADGKRAGRAGYAMLAPDGSAIGAISSGALSPTLGYPIALAFVEKTFAEPVTGLDLDVRGTRIPATAVALPFYKRER